jgi:hypothetical protein
MERETSAAMPQRCGALMALVTRYHSNAFVERQHALEAHHETYRTNNLTDTRQSHDWLHYSAGIR